MEPDPKTHNTWQLDRRISIPSLLAIVSAVVTVMLYIADLKTELSLVSQAHAVAFKSQTETDARQDSERNEMRRLWREDVGRIHEKLDRLIERR